jgi:hypothetical protein
MSARPTKKKWIAIVLISLFIIGSALMNNHSQRHLTATTAGTLVGSYSVESRSDYGAATDKTYSLNYSFVVEGRQYQGSDKLKTEPASPDCTVYYDPGNPEINALKSNTVDLHLWWVCLALGALALVTYYWLPTNPKQAMPEGTDPDVWGIGDAAGEYFTINSGQYDASTYVWITFFAQIALMIWAGTRLAQPVVTGWVSADLVTIGACLVALSYTFWIYWDRWKCTAVFASRFTTGCVNISIFFVPIAAFLYVNYRGLLKLRGR